MRQILTPRPKTKLVKKRKLNEGALPPRFALPQNTLGQRNKKTVRLFWPKVFRSARQSELLSNLVFEGFWSCCDLVGFGGFNSVFECDACDDFGEIVKAA